MGRAWASHIKLFCGPGLDILVAGRAGPGPHNSICGPGPGRVFTTAAGPGRAWASNHICGPGLGLDFRPVQDTSVGVHGFSSVWGLIAVGLFTREGESLSALGFVSLVEEDLSTYVATLKLTFRKYLALHTNYSLTNYTT